MRHVVFQTVAMQKKLHHVKKEKTIVCYYLFICKHIVNYHEDKTIYICLCRDCSDCPAS